jgi:L-2,4-diaminobutyrate decarboxylase
MAAAEKFAAFVEEDPRLELLGHPETGVVVWRPRNKTVDQLSAALPIGLASKTTVAGTQWLRCVAANPSADVDAIIDAVQTVI